MFSKRRASISNGFLIVVFAMIASSCSMKSKDANVTIQLPDWQAMKEADQARRSKVSTLAVTYSQLSMVIVNVTGGGLAQPVFYAWEKHDNSAATPPTTISLSIPKGTGRLVQVLATYEGGGSMEFYYGDVTTDMSSDVVPVPVTISNVATTNNQKEGKIAGRYVEAGGTGPTGVFQYRFSPPGGTKPSMVIHHGEIFNGWMSLFSLSSALIQYTKVDGTPIFTGFHNSNPALHDVSTSASRKRTVSLLVPAGYAKRGDDVNPTWLQRPERRIVVGYFGPGAGNRAVCQPMVGGVYNLDDYYASPSTTGSTVNFHPMASSLGTLNTYSEYVSSTLVGDTSANGFRGGVGASSFPGDCASQVSSALGLGTANEWTDYIALSVRGLGDEDPIAFRGPYASLGYGQDGQKWMTLAHNGATSVTVGWKYIPGVGISNSTVFWRLTADPWNDSGIRADDGFRCNDLAAMGFNQTSAPGAAESAVLNGIPEASLPQLQVVVCPFNPNAGNYFQSAIRGVGRIPKGVLGLKITGSNISTSDYKHTKSLAAGTTLRKGMFTDGAVNGFTMFVPTIDGMTLDPMDLVSIEASLDGSSWTSLTINDTTLTDGTPISFVFASAIAALPGFAGATDTPVYIRFEVDQTYADSYDLPSTVYTSPMLLAVGTTCTTPGTLQLAAATNTSETYTSGGTFLTDIVGVPNGTDIEKSYYLQYSGVGCAGLKVPIDRINIQASGLMCLAPDDIRRDPSDPFKIVISPSDMTGADCALSNHTIWISTPSNAESEKVAQFYTGGPTLYHSTVPAKIGPFLHEPTTTLSNLYSSYASIQYLMAGPSSNYRVYAAQLNSDGRVIDRSIPFYTGTNVEWTNNPSTVWASLPADGEFANLSTQPTLAAIESAIHSMFNIKLFSGAEVGGFQYLATGLNNRILSTANMWDAAVFVTKSSGNVVRIFAQRRLYPTNALAPQLFELTPPGGITTTFDNVKFIPVANNNGYPGYFVLIYENKIRYGALFTTSSGLQATYSAEVTVGFTSKILNVVDLKTSPSTLIVGGVSGAASYKFVRVTGPFYDAGALDPIDPNEYLVGAAVTGGPGAGRLIDFVTCDATEPAGYMVLADGAGDAYVDRIDASTVNLMAVGSPFALDASHNAVACTTVNPDMNGDGIKAFMFLPDGTASAAPAVLTSVGMTPTCSMSARDRLTNGFSGSPVTAVRYATGGNFNAPGGNSGPGFLYNEGAASGADQLTLRTMGMCSAGVVSFNSPTMIGTIPAETNKEFTGLVQFSQRPGMNGSGSFSIYGKNMQFMTLDIR